LPALGAPAHAAGVTVPLPETPVPVPEAEVTAPGTGVTVGPGGATVDVDPDKAIADLTGGNQQPGEPAADRTSGAATPQGNAGSGSAPRDGAAGPGGSAPSRGGSGADRDARTPAGSEDASRPGADAPSESVRGTVPALGQARNAAGRGDSTAGLGAGPQSSGSWGFPFEALLVLGLGAGAVLIVWARRREGSRDVEWANVDGLTGLPNYLAFEERLADEWRRARRYSRPLGVVLLDLDGVQRVNDRFGYEAGDRMIRAAADEIRDHIRASDLGARLTGDKFVVLCPETQHAGLKRLGKKLTEQLEAAGVGATVGCAQVSPRDAMPADLLARAHVAMYQKRQDAVPATARLDLAIAG
jgi:diguanylate cyclase (GGDEF)-like protein